MSITTLELYDALIAAGVDDAKAKAAAQAVLSREEATSSLATKHDMAVMTMWVAGLLVGQIAINTAIMALMFNYFL